MTPQPFTPDGVAAMLTELYALSDPDLLEQANLIRSDLSSWVSDNFTLTTAQQTYLSGIDGRWIQYNADLLGFAVENRLTITLITSGEPSDLKLIHTNNDIICTSDGSGFSTSGTVTLEVVYS